MSLGLNCIVLQTPIQTPTGGTRPPLMTRRQYTDPLGSDEEDEMESGGGTNRRSSEPVTPVHKVIRTNMISPPEWKGINHNLGL